MTSTSIDDVNLHSKPGNFPKAQATTKPLSRNEINFDAIETIKKEFRQIKFLTPIQQKIVLIIFRWRK